MAAMCSKLCYLKNSYFNKKIYISMNGIKGRKTRGGVTEEIIFHLISVVTPTISKGRWQNAIHV
jgi:hypothetical protein